MKLFSPNFCSAIHFALICEISDGFFICRRIHTTVPRLISPQTTAKLQPPIHIQVCRNQKVDGQQFLEKDGYSGDVVDAEVVDDKAEVKVDGSFLEGSQSNDRIANTGVMDESGGLFSSVILLNFVAILWGTQHAIIKNLVEDSAPDTYSLIRFGLAALLASPYLPELPSKKSEKSARETWRWGCELAIYQFLGFALQAIGLETTSASRSGFLLYLNVKFVPLFSLLIFNKSISPATWISALAAFVGTALLATDGSESGFCLGDIWSIAAAAASAMFILRLEHASTRVKNSSQLNAACLSVVAILSCMWAVAQGHWSVATLLDTLKSHPAELIYLGGIATALTNYLQTRAQRNISAERASIIYSLDPVYNAFFSWLLLHETLGAAQSYIGAVLITVAAATNAFADLGSGPKTSS